MCLAVYGKKAAYIARVSLPLILLSSGMPAKAIGPRDDRAIPEMAWDAAIKKFQFDADKFVGQRLCVKCPPLPNGQDLGGVYGTDAYPSDSSICVAALHAGAITKEGGTVTLQLNPGMKSYEGSVRHGVRTGDRPATRRSISFVTESTRKQNDALREEHLPRIDWSTKFTATGFAHRHLVGQQFTFRCPPVPKNLRPRIVYGTDVYGFSSIICIAALHSGQLSRAGGTVTVQLNPGVKQLIGSMRNGIETKSKRGSDRSLSFVTAASNKRRTAKAKEGDIR